MLKYLIIPLRADAVSFCHYAPGKDSDLIDLDVLKKALLWSMQQNLTVQFIYPDEPLPAEYKTVIDTVDHADIVGIGCRDTTLQNDIIVIDGWRALDKSLLEKDRNYVIRTTFSELLANKETLKDILPAVTRLVIVITDISSISETDLEKYRTLLDSLVPVVKELYATGHAVQFNLLTDRMLLESMNNCNAGIESITLAPDGRFYICPAFYLDGSQSVGDVATGPQIPNQQLYRLDHAPICRNCDAWQCRRCVWLNRHMTLEVNTPSREQCVASHLERNASKTLLSEIRKLGTFLPGNEIPEIDYLDPFDKLNK